MTLITAVEYIPSALHPASLTNINTTAICHFALCLWLSVQELQHAEQLRFRHIRPEEHPKKTGGMFQIMLDGKVTRTVVSTTKTMATRTTIYDNVVVYMHGAHVGNVGKKLLLQKMVNFCVLNKL
jgi:hypothetical protein